VSPDVEARAEPSRHTTFEFSILRTPPSASGGKVTV
jgi:hypothetical protein